MKGTPELRRRFKGLPAIRVAAGTKNTRTIRALDKMLCDLRDVGRFDYLRLVAEGAVTPLALYDRLRGQDYRQLPPPAVQRLADLVVGWQQGRDEVTAAQRANDRWAWKRLLASASPEATVEDVPALVKRERLACKASDQRAAFNHIKAAALAFLRDTQTVRARTYADTLDIPPLPKAAKRAGMPLDPHQAQAIGLALPMHHAALWYAMLTTGMGPKELWGRWEVEDGHLHIHGTKREGRDRLVPQWMAIARPPKGVSVKVFAAALKAASGGTVQPYDARRTYAKWLGLAGVDPIHQDAYMGHGPRTMTQLYQRGNVKPYLDADAARLRGWLCRSLEILPEFLRIGAPENGAGKGLEAVAVVTDAPRRSRTPNLLIRSQSPKAAKKPKQRPHKAQRPPDVAE